MSELLWVGVLLVLLPQCIGSGDVRSVVRLTALVAALANGRRGSDFGDLGAAGTARAGVPVLPGWLTAQ